MLLASWRHLVLPAFLFLLLCFLLLALFQSLRLLVVPAVHLLLLLLLAALELVLPLYIASVLLQSLLVLVVLSFQLLAVRILLLAHFIYFSLALLLQPRIDGRGVRRPRRGRTIRMTAPGVRWRIPRPIYFP